MANPKRMHRIGQQNGMVLDKGIEEQLDYL